MKNVLLTIAYDGTNFHGWQRQPHCRTVQGELESVLTKLCGQEIVLSGTSRTDAGVHALGQHATFSGDFGIPVDRIALAANHLLESSGDLRILKAEEVPGGFHARFDCKGKTYKYRIRFGSEPDIFSRNHCWQISQALDVEAMKKAAALFVGTHDFRCCMAAGGKEPETTVRTIRRLEVAETREGEGQVPFVTLFVTGDGFLYNMVRIITGTLVEIGLGLRAPEDVAAIIESKNRSRAGRTAPPGGLYLKEIYFYDDF